MVHYNIWLSAPYLVSWAVGIKYGGFNYYVQKPKDGVIMWAVIVSQSSSLTYCE